MRFLIAGGLFSSLESGFENDPSKPVEAPYSLVSHHWRSAGGMSSFTSVESID